MFYGDKWGSYCFQRNLLKFLSKVKLKYQSQVYENKENKISNQQSTYVITRYNSTDNNAWFPEQQIPASSLDDYLIFISRNNGNDYYNGNNYSPNHKRLAAFCEHVNYTS